MTNAEIANRVRRALEIANRIDAMRQRRWQSAMRAAGLDASMTAMSNAMISFSQGRPWRGVDYSALRRARRIAEDMISPGTLVDCLYMRLVRESRKAA